MKDLGIRKGEMVAIDGGNSPEYLMLWFGLDGIGACPSFINCHLTNQPLMHCVKVGRPVSQPKLGLMMPTNPDTRNVEREMRLTNSCA